MNNVFRVGSADGFKPEMQEIDLSFGNYIVEEQRTQSCVSLT